MDHDRDPTGLLAQFLAIALTMVVSIPLIAGDGALSGAIAPLSVWCNWFAWSPVLSLGCAIAAGYILNALFPIPHAESQMVADWVAANLANYTETTVGGGLHGRQCGRDGSRCDHAVAAADGVSALTPRSACGKPMR